MDDSQPPRPSQGVIDHIKQIYKVAQLAVSEKIAALTVEVTDSVMAVSHALSLHVDEVAHAYEGTCPDDGPDVDPLDLDSNYVTLLDALRRTYNDSYQMLVQEAVAWQATPPPLYEQPGKMSDLSTRLVQSLGVSVQACGGGVATAAAAALSTAKAPPPPPLDSALAEANANSE